MACGTLSAKLEELDRAIERMHLQIAGGETLAPPQLRAEIAALRAECAAEEERVRTSLQCSRAQTAKTLLRAYEAAAQVLQSAAASLGTLPADEAAAERRSLAAEYSLDFALLAAHRALLVSWEAIAAQREQREEKEI